MSAWEEDYGWMDWEEEHRDEVLQFQEIVTQTEKAYLLQTNRGKCWLAKSVVREINFKEKYVVFPDWVELKWLALQNRPVSADDEFEDLDA